MSKRCDKFLWLIPIILIWIVYWPALYNGFVYDDTMIFFKWLPKLKHLSEAFYYNEILFGQTSSPSYRPLQFYVLMLIRSFSGYDPWGYHLGVLILHTLNTVLVYVISLRFFKGKLAASLGALVAATLFALHPIHVEVIAWVAVIAELLLTLFFLLAFLFFTFYRENTHKKIWLVLSLLSFLLALFSKETAVIFLLVVFLYDILFTKAWRQKSVYLIVSYIAYVVIFIFYMSIRYLNTSLNPIESLTTTFGEGALKLFTAYSFYFYKFLWPNILNPFITILPSSTGFVLGSGIFSIIFIMVCLYTLRHNRKLFFHLMFFIITLFPGVLIAMSSITEIPLAERYIYLPSYGLCFVFGWIVTLRLVPQCGTRSLRLRSGQVGRNIIQSVKIFIWIVILLVSGVLSHERVKIWKDEFTFWRHAAQVNPHENFPLAMLGLQYIHQGNCPKAISYFDKGIAVTNKKYANPLSFFYVNKANCLYQMGHFDAAEDLFKEAIQISPQPNTIFNLGTLYYNQSKAFPQDKKLYLSKARDAFESAFLAEKQNAEFVYWLAATYEALGEINQAKHYYQLSFKLPNQEIWKQKAMEALERLSQQKLTK